MTACYPALVENTRRRYRKLTDEERQKVVNAHEHYEELVAASKAAKRHLDGLFTALHDDSVSPTSIADATGLHPTTVQKICTPSPNYRAKRERKS